MEDKSAQQQPPAGLCRACIWASCLCTICSTTRFSACSQVCVACDTHQSKTKTKMKRYKWIVTPLNWGLASLALSHRTTEPWTANQRQTLTSYGTEVRLTKCTLLGSSYLLYMERCWARLKHVALNVFLECMFLIYDTSLLPTVMLHSAQRHNTTMQSLQDFGVQYMKVILSLLILLLGKKGLYHDPESVQSCKDLKWKCSARKHSTALKGQWCSLDFTFSLPPT